MPFAPNAYTPDSIVIGIISSCRRLNVDDLATVCAIACSQVESGHKMYANDGDPHTKDYPYQAISFDKNSAGIYQQRAPWWDDPDTDDFGGSSDRMDIFRSTKMFINSLLKQQPNYHDDPGLAIANVQRPREDLRWKYGAILDQAWATFHRLKDAPSAPVPGAIPPAPVEPYAALKPIYTEKEMFGDGFNSRTRPIINFFLHTQEADASAESLAQYCQGQNGVSYHYTLRNGIVFDVVDTDYSSWSVLDANVFSVNLCFAGSFAAMTRTQWLERIRDIEIAAWIATQDCRKYPTMTTLVIPPPYRFHGPGIADHKYVTQALGIGTHHDVGDNFPWDVFEKFVLQFNGNANSGDEMTKEEHDALFQVWGALFNPVPSTSPYAPPDEGNRWPTKDLIQHIDGFVHGAIEVEHNAIILGLPDDIALIHQATQYDDERKAQRAKAAFARIPAKFVQEAATKYPELVGA